MGKKDKKDKKAKKAWKKKMLTTMDVSFLPSPDKLMQKEEAVKVTLALSSSSVEFFKKQAKKQGLPYQAMIRSLIDRYVTEMR